MVGPSHSSQNTANEYAAKHEPDVTKKMASLWENKVNENDGGKLASTFAKAPDEVAKGRKPRGGAPAVARVGARASRMASTGSTEEADAGPPMISRRKSIVEISTTYQQTAGASKEEMEKEVRRAVGEANAASAREGKRVEETRAKGREAERAGARDVVEKLERQMQAMAATVAELRATINA